VAQLLFVRLEGGTVRVFRADARSGGLLPLGDAPALSGAADLLLADPRGRFVYKIGGGSVQAFRIADAVSATLAPSGAATTIRFAPGWTAAINASGTFAYVSERDVSVALDCRGPGLVRAYAIDVLGTWSEVPRAGTAVTQANPDAIAFGRSGRTAYVAAAGDATQLYGPCPKGGISGYAVDAGTGTLTPLPGEPYEVSYGALQLKTTPSGAFAYVLKREDDYGLWVVDYRVNEGTGALTEVGRVKLFGNYPGRLLVDPSERFVYASAASDSGQSLLSVLRITPSGALDPVPGSPFEVETTLFVMEPEGRWLYFGAANLATIDARSVDPVTGNLTKVAGFPLSVPGPIYGLVFVRPGS
jgi:6-phosphogluconolactonase (cycloisomerase 2 family)